MARLPRASSPILQVRPRSSSRLVPTVPTLRFLIVPSLHFHKLLSKSIFRTGHLQLGFAWSSFGGAFEPFEPPATRFVAVLIIFYLKSWLSLPFTPSCCFCPPLSPPARSLGVFCFDCSRRIPVSGVSETLALAFELNRPSVCARGGDGGGAACVHDGVPCRARVVSRAACGLGRSQCGLERLRLWPPREPPDEVTHDVVDRRGGNGLLEKGAPGVGMGVGWIGTSLTRLLARSVVCPSSLAGRVARWSLFPLVSAVHRASALR